MKKVIVALTAIILTASVSFAQPSAKPAGAHKHDGQHMRAGHGLQKLNLSDAQKQQLKSLNDGFRKQMQDLDSKENITVKEQRNQRAAIAKAHHEAVEKIFTPEQKQQLTDMKAKRENRVKELGAKQLDHMKTKLNLTDAQVATIKSNREQAMGKIKAIADNKSLDREAKKQQLKELHETMKANMDKVLTSEQKTKWQEMHKERLDKAGEFRQKRMPRNEVK